MQNSNLDTVPSEMPEHHTPQTSPWAVHRDDVPIEGGLNPDYGSVLWQTLICKDRMGSEDIVLGVAKIPAYGTLPLHRHDPAEFYYFVAGHGEVTIDGTVISVNPGAAVFIPGAAEHGISAGPNGIEFLYGFAQNRFEDVVYNFSAMQGAE